MKKNSGQATKRSKKQSENEENIETTYENEIIIGLTPKQPKTKNRKNKNVGVVHLSNQKRRKTKNDVRMQTTKNKSKKQPPKKSKHKLKIIKWVLIIIILLIAITLFMLSSVFNIKQIVVTNNSKISSEEIINLSTLIVGNNMFKTTNKTIRNSIKTNPYIENVKIKRNLNGTVTLEIEERIPTYMLQIENSYVYINNQGYILEISETALEIPVITGYQTDIGTITEGNRLEVEDLKKLEDVIKIIESAKNSSLAGKITKINIEDSSNYILTIESEGKTVRFGDNTNIRVKILKIEAIIEEEKGVEGEIYFQNSEKTVFREAV